MSGVETVINLLTTAIEDLRRGDRIDALDMIRIAEKKIRDSLPAGYKKDET